jgi:hypothetical protein
MDRIIILVKDLSIFNGKRLDLEKLLLKQFCVNKRIYQMIILFSSSEFTSNESRWVSHEKVLLIQPSAYIQVPYQEKTLCIHASLLDVLRLWVFKHFLAYARESFFYKKILACNNIMRVCVQT